MHWRRLGRISLVVEERSWARSHAMVPTPVMLSPKILRIYMAHVGEDSAARVGYVDVTLAEPTKVIATGLNPVLDIGQPGTFDDNGVNASCVVEVAGEFRMYYVGYQRHCKIPYTLLTGLAVSRDPDG